MIELSDLAIFVVAVATLFNGLTMCMYNHNLMVLSDRIESLENKIDLVMGRLDLIRVAPPV